MLTISKSDKHFFQMLRESGLDPKKTAPARTWEVFKEFCEVPVRCLRQDVLVECGNFYPGENLFHITFVRRFVVKEKADDIFIDLECDFNCAPNSNLPDKQTYCWSSDFLNLTLYFNAVENLISFQKAMREPIENWDCNIVQSA